jgi:membrane fusion protein, multidrug efflux system
MSVEVEGSAAGRPPRERTEPGEGERHPLFVILAIAFVVVAGLVMAVLYVHRRAVERDQRAALDREQSRGPLVRIVRVETTKAQRTLALPGDVHGFNQTTLYAKLSGYIEDIRVNRGDRVKTGQILATIESPETVQDALAAQHSASIAKITANRFDTLGPSGVVSQQDRDTADAQKRITQSEFGRAQAVLQYAVVRAPFNGVITARYVDPGALVPAATSATQTLLPIVDVADVDTLRVFVYVGQDAAPFIHLGNEAKVWQIELPEKRIPAKVTFTTGALDPRTRTMQVEVDFDNRAWGMLPGTYANVEIDIDEPKSALISTEGLVIRDGKTMVAEIRDGKVHYVTIGLGYNDGRNVRVLRGLSGGETIALNAPVELNDGDPVQMVSEAGSPPGAPPASPAPSH